MTPFIRNVLLVFAALFPIVNPLGMAPIFAEMTMDYTQKIRNTVAMRVAINGMALLIASLFVGSYILEFFGISMGAVQLGGGLVVMIAGWQILNKQNDTSERQQVTPSTEAILSQAFYPLTMPLTVGPGSIAVALTLGSNSHAETHLQLILTNLAAVVGIILIGVAIYLCFALSEGLQRILGPTGTSILIRLSAFIVLCIGIQIMFNGVHDLYHDILAAK
jgi:multiple antibiotic resistance protein